MAITRDDVTAGYREILASPAPNEATMQELLRSYSNVATFRRRLNESAEGQRILAASHMVAPNRSKH